MNNPPQEVNDFREHFVDSIADIQRDTIIELNELVGDSETEKKRIIYFYEDVILNAAYRHNETGENIDDCLIEEQQKASSKQKSYIELLLSRAIHHSVKSAYHYQNAQMKFALSNLIEANFYLGAYKATISSNLDYQLERSELARAAASKRHAQGRVKEEEIIQYYRENRKTLGTKDDAAFILAKKFHLASSTIRDYLKGV